ncbi:MAG TPA: acetylxylan esterase [Devosia sp.]|nr:acetylxylan esterase [Devosia sp.]
MPLYDLRPDLLQTYRSEVVPPADFDAFWSATLAEARQVPISARFVPVDSGLKLFDVFDLSYAGFAGQEVKGWFILPRGATGKLPLVIRYIGYGGGRSLPLEHLAWPAAGYAHLVMDTRGQGSAWSPGDTADPVGSDAAHPGFMTRGILSPATYYYRRVFTDAVRAVEAGVSHPAVDGAHIAVVGGSQGGGISLAAAGLEPRIGAIMADVPFLCDFPRAVRIAQRDPYLEISRYLAIHRDHVRQVFDTLRYFDGTVFAQRIGAPALVSVAQMDTICPPSTVYAAFNALRSADKSIIDYAFNDHEGGGIFQAREQLDWLAKRFG